MTNLGISAIHNSTFIIPRFEVKRGQVILRHTERTAYRCFLPDLAGFTGFCCTGPGPYLYMNEEL